MQIISGLRDAGHRVTFSMPLGNYLGKKNIDRVLPLLSKEELWASEHFFEPEVVLNRFQPEISITCNVNTFRQPPTFANEIIHILDLYGPLQFEGLLLDNPDYEAAMRSGPLLEERCRTLIQSFRGIDYVVTVSERQKYFWSAYCSLAGFSFAELNLLVCPAAFHIPPVQRNPSPQLSLVYSGGFYPWQNPNRFLEQTATILDGLEGATLHVFGGPHVGLANEAEVRVFLEELQRHRSVCYHGYRPAEEVLETLSRAWCALELMERNIERELAVTGRTLEFLSTGTPVIYNNYSTLSRLIEQYGAGWTVPVEGEPPLEPIFKQLIERGLPLVEELSKNASRLAAQEFSAEKAISPLAQLCGSRELTKRSSKGHSKISLRAGTSERALKPKSFGRVLVIAPAMGALFDLRLGNPLRALHRQGFISGLSIAGPDLRELQHDSKHYDIILTQRSLPRAIYELLENLSVNFILDVDDNLLARPSYRTEKPEFEIVNGLRLCKTATMPNPRLMRGLEQYTGLTLAHKTFITPNALPFSQETATTTAQVPSQIIWIQSDIAALDYSRDQVVGAVETFSKVHELPVVLIGRNVLNGPQFTNQILMGEIDFAANLQLLATAPLSIGVAPLETHADRETLDFVAGKSDLKMLLFAGYSHAGVYSAAPPYTDSPLQNSLTIVANSAAEWNEALEYEFREGWKRIAEITRTIQTERNIDKVARENWLPAIEAGRLSRPVTGSELYNAYHSAMDMGRTPIHTLAYLQANDDVLAHCMVHGDHTAWMHYSTHGRQEGRGVRHSLRAQRNLMSRIEREAAQVVSDVRKEISRLHEHTRFLERRSEELKEQMEHLEGHKEELEAEKAELRRALSAIVESKSWRLTAPLRHLMQRTRSI